MKPNQHLLQHQLEVLAHAVTICEQTQGELSELQIRLADEAEQRTQRLTEIERDQTTQLEQELRQLRVRADQERETLRLDLQHEAASFRTQKEQKYEERVSEINEKLSRLAEQKENELWVLQSVLDDGAEGELAREQENFRTQKLAVTQRAAVLEQQLRHTQQYLKECHTAVSVELPAPDHRVADGETVVEAIREAGDQVLAEAGRLEAQSLPRFIRGPQLWMLSLTAALLVFVPVLLIRVAPGSLLNPDIASPNWQWVTLSALCGFVAAACLAAVCVTATQSRLRNGFQGMLQQTSNARSLAEQWEVRSQKRLDRMERGAEKWRTRVTRQREQRTAAIEARFADQQATLERMLELAKQEYQADLETHADQLRLREIAELEQLDRRLQEDQRRVKQATADRIRQLQSACISELDGQAQTIRMSADHLLDQWKQQLVAVRQLTQESVEAGTQGHRWPPSSGTDWTPPKQMPAAISAGDLLVTLPKVPDSAVQPSTTNLCVEIPAVLAFPEDTSVLVEHDAAGREAALSFLRTQILRLLTVIPPGRIRLTLIDPAGLGQSFSALMHLADYDELLIHSRIWTDETQVRNQLRKTTEHMENVFQTYLRSEFSTIEEYNASAGEVAEPYHFVVVAGFPQAFTEESAGHLTSILTSGPRCGVHALIAWNPATPCPPGFDPAELKMNCVHFRVHDQMICPFMELPESVQFEAVPEPAAPEYVNIVKAVGEKSKDARRVEVSFRRIAPRPQAVWTQSTAESIDLPIGRAGAARLQYLRLGRGTSQHVLVAGKTGSGKSTFLHIVITNLALHYSPTEIQFYLIDFKKGVEFRTYAANRLPHARVVAIESDREFGLSVLERLDAILQERGDLFRSRGVQDLPTFRTRYPEEAMPRLLLLIDEFQEFFVAEDRVASRASLLLDRLVRQGRAFGIHIMLGSQTLGGAYSLARSTMGQVAVRIALQCSESDAHLILSEDNSAARLLTRPGEAIYNDANGLKDGNHPFQIAWLDEDLREEMIRQLTTRADVPALDTSMIVFEGNVAPTVEQCGPLLAAFRNTSDATRRSFDARPIWLGEPVAIAAPTHVELRRAGGQNLLLVGQDEELIDSMLGMILLSACAGGDSAAGVTLVHSARNEDTTQRFSHLQASGAVPGCQLCAADSCDGTIEEAFAELKRREGLSDHADAAELLMIIRNIGQFRELRRDEDEFSLGSFGEAKTETTASMFGDLIRRGPLMGIHVIVWSDTLNNAMRWLSSSLLREFEYRIALRMNQTDSASLVDAPVAAGLGTGRALLYRDQTGAVEKFRPFAWPSDRWLAQVVAWRNHGSGSGLDIESLRIE